MQNEKSSLVMMYPTWGQLHTVVENFEDVFMQNCYRAVYNYSRNEAAAMSDKGAVAKIHRITIT